MTALWNQDRVVPWGQCTGTEEEGNCIRGIRDEKGKVSMKRAKPYGGTIDGWGRDEDFGRYEM
jgi:hypothetical protein